MQEIKIENDLNLKVLINGTPDITLMSQDVFNAFISALELQISDYYKDTE